ncbi:MAG TPA: phospholipid carrier-dependent glycosyltransferase, partial [Gemmatimonadaceae bacterium]
MMPVEPVARPINKPELFVLTALSAVLHWWRLFTPDAVVFDELHYKHFAGHYLDGTHYYDVHPPLAKLLFAAVAKLSGASAQAMLGSDPVVSLRILPALLGTLVVPLVYVILRQLGAQRNVATIGASAILLENALLVDSRFALIEPIMIPFGLMAVALYLGARNRDKTSRWLLLVASAFAAGLSFSAKWTGASALAVVLSAWAFDVWRARRPLGR